MAVNPNEIGTLLKSLREKVESKESGDALVQEEIKKINLKLDEAEKSNQELTKKLLAKEKEEQELKEKFTQVEKKLYRIPGGLNANEKAEAVKAFEKFIQFGDKNLTTEEMKYLRTDSDPEGGYLTPGEFVNEIIKDMTELSPIRSVARVRKTGKGYIEVRKRTAKPSFTWVGEGEEGDTSNSKYGMLRIELKKVPLSTEVSIEMLNDSAFNMESEINADFREFIAEAEGEAFLLGNGVTRPRGILTHPDVAKVKTGVANAISADSLIKITGEVKSGYKPAYGLNRKTLAEIRTLKAGDGHYLWQAGNLQGGIPNVLNGYPYLELAQMEDIGAGKTPVIFGDYLKGYTIVDGVQYAVIRDPFTKAKSGLVVLTLMYRVGGEVILPEAIKKLTCEV